MTISLGYHQYGKAEVRLVHIDRSTAVHQIKDGNVTSQLIDDFAATHYTGDNSAVIATDTQKNTVYALARLHGVGPIEEFALRMARHFVDKYSQVNGSRQEVEEFSWSRITTSDSGPHDHAFTRGCAEVRTTVVTNHAADEVVISGLRDLTVLKSTGSEFHGFPRSSTPRWPRPPTGFWPRWYTRGGAMWASGTTGTTFLPASAS
jgi:urate oxidase